MENHNKRASAPSQHLQWKNYYTPFGFSRMAQVFRPKACTKWTKMTTGNNVKDWLTLQHDFIDWMTIKKEALDKEHHAKNKEKAKKKDNSRGLADIFRVDEELQGREEIVQAIAAFAKLLAFAFDCMFS